MIRLEDVSVVFSGRILFQDLNWQITEGARIALIGVNGSGKSTLLKVISGEQEVDSGRVVQAKNFTIGYLPQELYSAIHNEVFEEALKGCGSTREIRIRLEEVTEEMQHQDPQTDEYHELVLEHGRLQRLFEEMDGFTAEARTARVLQGLRVPEAWWKNSMSSLSGGWQMRIHLAKLILSEPSLLLLDEPTNHLDVESILWLSGFLRTYEGGLLLISHDRYFLDENTRQTVELWNGKLHYYAGNYSYYRKEKEARLELLKNAYQNQQLEIARSKEFIDRFRYKATKARQVQSRIKLLEKMEKIELPEDTAEIRLKIPEAPRSGRFVLEASRLSHSYGATPVFHDLEFKIERGEKIALVGVNGAGKTTLLKILAGVMPPTKGEIKPGHNVYHAYYAQLVTDQLDLRRTILDEVRAHAPDLDETRLRSVLGSFLFRGDDVYKKISVLSGGEKSRVALAKILLKPSNFLLLDEPTNHLDLQSKEILLNALKEYEGAILFISHDRYFMDQLSQKVLELRDGVLTTYLSNYSEYLQKISGLAASQPAQAEEQRSEQQPASTFYKSKEQKKKEAEQRQMLSKMKKHIIEPLNALEQQINASETKLKELEALLADDSVYQSERFQEYLQQYQKTKKDLEGMYARWEELQKKKETFNV